MRVLITGGTGFIGAEVVRRLVAEGGHAITVFHVSGSQRRLADVADRVTLIRGDVGNFCHVLNAVKAARPQAILHLGAILRNGAGIRPTTPAPCWTIFWPICAPIPSATRTEIRDVAPPPRLPSCATGKPGTRHPGKRRVIRRLPSGAGCPGLNAVRQPLIHGAHRGRVSRCSELRNPRDGIFQYFTQGGDKPWITCVIT